MKPIWILLAVAMAAMAAEPIPLSLKRAVEIATSPEGSARIQLAGEAANVAAGRQAESRAALLPNLDATAHFQNATRNLEALGLRLDSPIPGFQLPTFVGPFNNVDARVT